ncbi:MAG: class I SAM-dependent methyltransferase [Candidatus Jordarchaeum sp.]|uniref:class I SAM-dependent methyltransferase n=1 Tax=Candidatus Jordarchaeum sp. TaxID=2823881 RepID=UPI004049B450
MLTVKLNLLQILDKDIVLDAGCGAGRHTMEASKWHDSKFVAVDRSLSELKRLKYVLDLMAEKGELKGNAVLIVGDVLQLPFKDESFTKIICTEVLEHLYKDVKGIKELVRVLKNHEEMAISVPTPYTEHLFGNLSYEYFRTPGGHVRIYKKRELLQKLRYGGLKILYICREHAFHSIFWMLKCLCSLENQNALIPAFWEQILIFSARLKLLKKIENFWNNLFPKSIVIYTRKEV